MTGRGRRGYGAPTFQSLRLRGDERVPFLDHVAVLIHHGVPAGHGTHALVERAAVTNRTGLLHHGALRALDVALGRLAFHPEAPLVLRHIGLGRLEHRRVVALTVQEAADPTGQVPVDVVVGRRELRARQVLGDGETVAPRAVAFLERLVLASHALRADRGNRRRPHRLDHDLARGHQVDRLVEGLPEGAELTVLLGLDQEVDRLVDLRLGHVALVAVFDDAGRLADHRGIHDADRGDVQDRGLALELRIQDVLPLGDLAT